MPIELREMLLAQLQTVVDQYEQLRKTAKHWNLSGSEPSEAYRVTSLARTAVTRVAGRNSEYARQLEEIRDHLICGHPRFRYQISGLTCLPPNPSLQLTIYGPRPGAVTRTHAPLADTRDPGDFRPPQRM